MKPENQFSLSIEDIFSAMDQWEEHKNMSTEQQTSQVEDPVLKWHPSEYDFVICLNEDNWCLGQVSTVEAEKIQVNLLMTTKTRARDYAPYRYWAYPEGEDTEWYEEKNCLKHQKERTSVCFVEFRSNSICSISIVFYF